MRAAILVALAFAMVGCPGTGPAVDAGRDAGALDASLDAPRDGGAGDAPMGTDAPLDAPRDAGLDARVDGGIDAPSTPDGGIDAGTDVGGPDAPAPIDSGTDAPTSGTVITCAPVVPPAASGGLACDATFWPGFQFDVAADSHLIGVGVQGSGDGSIHVSIVRVASAGATPMIDDPGSIAAQSLLPLVPGAPVVRTVSMDAILTTGRYALVVGTGAFGATASSASIPSGGPSGCTISGGFPYTLRTTDDAYIAQGASPHMFVVFE